MKKILITLAILLFMAFGTLIAQLPPHPNNGNSPNSGNTPVGGGAPISGGLIILASLGIGYTTRKVYALRRKSMDKILN